MNKRSRFLPPLAASLLLGTALAVSFLGTGPEAEFPRLEVLPEEVSTMAPAPVFPVSTPTEPERMKAEPRAEGGRGTEVPIGPGDVVPEPEVANPLPQQNDPLEPEKPQTAAWRHGKMVRMTELLGRDVERLEEEREEAESRGDEGEATRLEVQLERHRTRLDELREQTESLAEAAREEEETP